MMEQKENKNNRSAEDQADELIVQLLHLKQYETPDASRMIKNKQNIMRLVREANSQKRKSFGERLEMNIPWFFSEPRYGIAALFVAFAALQFISHNHMKQMISQTGIYTNIATMEQSTSVATNNYQYPSLPAGSKLFDNQQNNNDVKFVGRLEEE